MTALILVADIVPAKAEVELRSETLADTALTDVPLILPPLRFVRAEMLVPDIVGDRAEVELRSPILADSPLKAAELTLVVALMFVADIVGANAEGADTADSALSPLTVADVADTIVANADGADTADKALNPLTVAEVADTLVLNADVELRSANLADTPLIAAELTFVVALIFVADIFNMKAEGALTADNALNPLTVADVADTLVLRADVELKSANLALTPLIAAELTFVVALIFVAEMFTMKAEGADTADSALRPLTVADVAETRVLRADVELRSVNLADTPLIAAELTFVAALIFVADIF